MMEGLLLQEHISDTIFVIDTNKVVDFYSDLLEKQSTPLLQSPCLF